MIAMLKSIELSLKILFHQHTQQKKINSETLLTHELMINDIFIARVFVLNEIQHENQNECICC